jgi:hypothetical protein
MNKGTVFAPLSTSTDGEQERPRKMRKRFAWEKKHLEREPTCAALPQRTLVKSRCGSVPCCRNRPASG